MLAHLEGPFAPPGPAVRTVAITRYDSRILGLYWIFQLQGYALAGRVKIALFGLPRACLVTYETRLIQKGGLSLV